MTPDIRIEEWRLDDQDAAEIERDLDMLADVLHAVVHDGAGVSFVVPFSTDAAREFWVDKVLPGVRSGTRRVAVARRDARIVGTAQLEFAWPPNQQHRADVTKLLVHPEARRQGIARALMLALEEIALTGGRTERLYQSLGYVTVGVIPRFARGSLTAALEPTTIMYKELRAAPPRR